MTVRAAWREGFYADVIERCQALGVTDFDGEKIWSIIEKTQKQKKSKGKQAANYRRAMKMTARGKSGILNGLKKVWPGSVPKKRKNAKPAKKAFNKTSKKSKKKPAPPAKKKSPPPPTEKPQVAGEYRWVDPECKACAGTGRSSSGRQCEPCQKNGPAVPPMGVQMQEAWNRKFPDDTKPIPPPPKRPPPPAPKTKRKPPPPPAKAKKAPPPPKKEKPLPPATVGKTYSGQKHPKSAPGGYKHRVCFRLDLTGADADNVDEVVTDTLNNYLVQQTEFGACVKETTRLGPGHFDAMVHYSIHITKAFAALKEHAWVRGIEAIPAADFGRVGVAQ